MDDFLLLRLRKDISYFYDTWYAGNVKNMKIMHLMFLEEYYDSNQFKGLTGIKLRKEKIKFLEKLQNSVNEALY